MSLREQEVRELNQRIAAEARPMMRGLADEVVIAVSTAALIERTPGADTDIPWAVISTRQGIDRACESLTRTLRTPTLETPSHDPQYRELINGYRQIIGRATDSFWNYDFIVRRVELAPLVDPEGKDLKFYQDNARLQREVGYRWALDLSRQFGPAMEEALTSAKHTELFGILARTSLIPGSSDYPAIAHRIRGLTPPSLLPTRP